MPDKPFEQLAPEDQQVAIDLTVACSILVTRLPSISQEVFKVIEREFAAQQKLPSPAAKYALRHLGRELFAMPWEFHIAKDSENNISTHFIPISDNGAGEQH